MQIDLIDVNDPTGRFVRPTEAELNAFRDALTEVLDGAQGGAAR